MIARARGCGPCGVSILILSMTTAASTQLNKMILRIVIALGPSGPDQGGLVARVPGELAGHSDRSHRSTLGIESLSVANSYLLRCP
jgi:hypothetical protein